MNLAFSRRHGSVIGFGIVLAVMAGATPYAAADQPPRLLNYQGRVMTPGDGADEPLETGDYDMAFRIYDAAENGTEIWGPQHFDGESGHNNEVSVANGYFGVILGPQDHSPQTRALEAAFTGETRYLEVTVTMDSVPVTIAPRQRILGTPYAMRSLDGVPPGTIMPYAGPADEDGHPEKVPRGWLLCDGRALGSSVYPDLFAVIGTNWGTGSKEGGKAADFNLPDLRGVFVAGLEDENDLGAHLPDSLYNHRHAQSHKHPAGELVLGLYFADGRIYDYGYADISDIIDYNTYQYYGSLNAENTTSGGNRGRGINLSGETGTDNHYLSLERTLGPAATTETRPKNAYVNFIIKY